MANRDLTGKVGEVKDVQEVEVKRIIPVPKFIRIFAIKPYLRKPSPHYNSRNSGLDYSA